MWFVPKGVYIIEGSKTDVSSRLHSRKCCTNSDARFLIWEMKVCHNVETSNLLVRREKAIGRCQCNPSCHHLNSQLYFVLVAQPPPFENQSNNTIINRRRWVTSWSFSSWTEQRHFSLRLSPWATRGCLATWIVIASASSASGTLPLYQPLQSTSTSPALSRSSYPLTTLEIFAKMKPVVGVMQAWSWFVPLAS